MKKDVHVNCQSEISQSKLQFSNVFPCLLKAEWFTVLQRNEQPKRAESIFPSNQTFTLRHW